MFNHAHTRQLIHHLRSDATLRQLCGWRSARHLPHESIFSRAFAQFAQSQLPQWPTKLSSAARTNRAWSAHIARDSTAIAARERFPEAPSRKPRPAAAPRRPRKLRPRQRWQPPEQASTRLERQREMRSVSAAIVELPTACSIGVKTSSSGRSQYWRGYKLHLDVADGQIPITALLTSANVHDSQTAIPMMRLTLRRTQYLYDLMDAAYDAEAISFCRRALGHVPIVDPKQRPQPRTQLPALRKPKREVEPAQRQHYTERIMVERVFSRLKDQFGGRTIRVRGPDKVMAHLMFGVLAITADQLLKLAR